MKIQASRSAPCSTWNTAGARGKCSADRSRLVTITWLPSSSTRPISLSSEFLSSSAAGSSNSSNSGWSRTVCAVARGGQDHGACQELLLPSRDQPPRLALIVGQPQVSPVRAGLGATEKRIALRVIGQCFSKRPVCAPARRVIETDPVREQSDALLLERRQRCLQNAAPRRIDPLAQGNEFSVPRRNAGPGRRILERGVALLERSAEPPPQIQVTGFHVERDPVQKPPALVRPTANEVVDRRVDDLQGQRRGQCRSARLAFPIDTYLKALTAVPNPDADCSAAQFDTPEQHEGVLTMPDEVAGLATPKRLSPAEVRQRLQHTRLAGGVRPVDQRIAGVWLKLDVLETAKILCRERLNRHRLRGPRRPRAASA